MQQHGRAQRRRGGWEPRYAIGRPITLQYGREQFAPVFLESSEFIRTDYVITAVGARLRGVVIAELALLYVPDLPPRAGVIASSWLGWGGKFTGGRSALSKPPFT